MKEKESNQTKESIDNVSSKQIELLQEKRFESEIIKVEGNLLEIPIADYSRGEIQQPKKNYVTYLDKERGTKTEIGSMYGALTGFDERVFKGGVCYFSQEQETDDKGKSIYIANFSLWEIAKHLGLALGGRTWERLKTSLKRIGSLTLTHTGILVYENKDHKEYHPIAGYPVFKSWLLPNQNDKNRENWFLWNEILAENFFQKYHRILKARVYLALPTPISTRLYDYLNKKFGSNNDYSEEIIKFMAKIPIQEKIPARRTKILIKNLEILKETWGREDNIVLKYWIKNGRVFFTKFHKKTKGEYKEVRDEFKEDTKRRNECFTKFLEYKVNENVALSLFKDYNLDIIETQIKWLPYRSARNKSSILVKSIKENWTMPARYENEVEQKRREGIQNIQ